MMIDFSTAFRWLNQFDPTCLRVASRELALQLDGSLRHSNRAEIERCMRQLLVLAEQDGRADELAEAYALCARAAYRLNELARADHFLEEAHRLYHGQPHKAGVVEWLRGCALWAMTAPERYQHALVLWQHSLERFERAQGMSAFEEPGRSFWYADRMAEMRATLAARADSLSMRAAMLRAPRPTAPRTKPAAPSAAAEPADVRPGTWTQEFPAPGSAPLQIVPSISVQTPALPEDTSSVAFPIRLQTFTISDLIPAGGLGPLGTDPHPVGYVQIDRLIIDERIYRIVPLKKNGSVINLSGFLSSSRRFTVLRVKGDSMNRTEIQDGDYILVLLQNDARDGDIVVAGPHEEEAQGTLKRLHRRGALIELVPESTNPEHPVRSYPADQIQGIISGVALAVLKEVQA